MLSSVLNSPRAIEMSILVVNAFVRMRELIASNKDLANRVEKLEHAQNRTASVIEVLIEDIDRLGEDVKRIKALPEPKTKKRRIWLSLPGLILRASLQSSVKDRGSRKRKSGSSIWQQPQPLSG